LSLSYSLTITQTIIEWNKQVRGSMGQEMPKYEDILAPLRCAASCLLPAVCCLLSAVCCLLPVCLLSAVCYLLSSA
jgi:hypothetical protein